MTDLIVQAYNQSYTKAKKDNILGFTNVLATDLLENIATKYIKLTQPEMNREWKSVEDPWNQEEVLSKYLSI